MIETILAIMDGSKERDWGNAAIASICSILLVFLVLIIIIALTHLIFKLLGYIDLKKEIDEKKKGQTSANNTVNNSVFDENDEEMVAAVLTATIDYRNECKQDVKLVSVKEIK